MAIRILTPQTLWDGFKAVIGDYEMFSEKETDGVVIKEFFLSRQVLGSNIRIFFRTAQKKEEPSGKFVFLLQSVGETVPEDDLKNVVGFGYSAVTADFAGSPDGIDDTDGPEGKFRHTIYPEALGYLNYCFAKKNLFGLGGDAEHSPIYQYACDARYVIAFLREVLEAEDVALIAFKESVTAGFHIAATENLACFAAVQGCGWQIMKDGSFISEAGRDLSEEERIAVAGVEAQSYADKVKCPTMMFLSTGYKEANFDRISDTLALFSEDVYSAAYITVSAGEYLDYKAGKDVLFFLNKYLAKKDEFIPKMPELIHCTRDEKSALTLKTSDSGIKTVEFFVASRDLPHEERVWKRFGFFSEDECKKSEFEAEYVPVQGTDSCEFFARVKYENGFIVSSPVVYVDYTKHDVKYAPDFGVVYCSSSAVVQRFEPAELTVKTVLDFKIAKDLPEVKKGIAGIEGISCERGIKTMLSYKNLTEDSILVFDACAKADAEFTVELVTDEFSEWRKSYYAGARVAASNYWNKIQIELKKFKTEDGRPLKDYEDINVLIISKGDFLVNNIIFI